MKKTNGRSRTVSHKHDVIGTNPKKQHRKGANNIVNNHHITWHDAQPSMMHVRFNEAWHDKVHKQYYKISGAQNAFKLFSLISFMYPTMLNVVKHGKRVKQMKTTYLGKFK